MSFKGKHHTQISKDKIAETHKRKGIKPPTPKIKIESKSCLCCKKIINRKKGRSYFTKQKYCGIECRGLARRTPKKRCSVCLILIAKSARKFCRKCWQKQFKGKNVPSWRGGISLINNKERQSEKYKLWRNKVFKRDDYTCQECGKRGVKLNAHHKERFSKEINKRHKLKNGITLCEDCHKKTDNYGNRGIEKTWLGRNKKGQFIKLTKLEK